MTERHTNIPATYLVLKKDGRVLLSRRFNTGYEDGKYSLVAGHVERGETFTHAIIREAYEEAGVLVKKNDLQAVHVMQRKSNAEIDRVEVFFAASEWRGEIENKEPDQCDDLAWFDIERLPENMVPCVRHALECIRRGEIYSQFGW